jgi:two-component system, response regulator YesN
MKEHIALRLTVQGVAHEFGLSPSRFEHLIKTETGSSFRASLRAMRLSRAKVLLSDPRLRIKEIAAQCGYAHTSNLAREFKRQFGLAPSAYRRQVRLTNSM